MKSGPTFPERVASIDIGTNTILLLIAEVSGGELKTLYDTETVVRLGEGVHQTGFLSESAMERGIQTLKDHLDRCQRMEVQKIFAVGTNALREAKNSDLFRQRVKEKLHLDIQVISGEEEARLSFLAVVRDFQNSLENLLVVDVGGGSTELILGQGDQIIRWESLPLGIVRFTERFLLSDPVTEEEYQAMVGEIQKQLLKFSVSYDSFSMVSIGGTGTALASVEQKLETFRVEKIHRFVLTREALKHQISLYRSRTVEERRKIKGLSPSRADVILAGGAILFHIMEKFDCSSLTISAHGVRYGLLYKQIADCGLQILD